MPFILSILGSIAGKLIGNLLPTASSADVDKFKIQYQEELNKSEELKVAVAKAALADDQVRAQIQASLASEQQNLNTQALTDLESAKSHGFMSDYRDVVGWVCTLALGWQYLAMPIIQYFSTMTGHPVPVPAFDASFLVNTLMPLLGIGTTGALKTYEKTRP